MEVRTEPDEATRRVNVKIEVNEGRRNFVRRVQVSGYRTTRPRLIYDRIPLETGDPLSQSAVIDAQRRLYDLGIFAKVDIALQNPDGKERDKNVLYRLEEASRYSYTFGFGAQLARIGGGLGTFDSPAGAPGFSPRVNFGVSRVNFLGVGHTLSFRSQISNFQKRAVVNYYAPQFTGKERLNLSFTSLYDDSRDIRTFAAQRVESSIQLGQRLSKAQTVQYRFTFRRVQIDDTTLSIDPALIPLFSQPVRLGIVSASFVQDRRDDPIDSRRGSYNTIDFGFAGSAFGSQSDFLRLIIRNSTYHRLRREMVLARLTTLGGIYSLSGRTPARDVPLPERYFSGGGSTHRGFPDNQAGPRDLSTGFPLGGKALLMNTLELRFPLIGDTIGGVLYHDMGNVYRDLDKISFRTRQRDVQDFDYMVHTGGFGIRYRTPVGPVRFDIGFSPNSPKFFGFKGTREELVQGGGSRLVQRINQLQFHFSLGQTF
jgi:outer membrane protein assembly complex protein YaeT